MTTLPNLSKLCVRSEDVDVVWTGHDAWHRRLVYGADVDVGVKLCKMSSLKTIALEALPYLVFLLLDEGMPLIIENLESSEIFGQPEFGFFSKLALRLQESDRWPLHGNNPNGLKNELQTRLDRGEVRIKLRITNVFPLIVFRMHREKTTMYIEVEEKKKLRRVGCINNHVFVVLKTVHDKMNIYSFGHLLPKSHRTTQFLSADLSPFNVEIGTWLKNLFLKAINYMHDQECKSWTTTSVQCRRKREYNTA